MAGKEIELVDYIDPNTAEVTQVTGKEYRALKQKQNTMSGQQETEGRLSKPQDPSLSGITLNGQPLDPDALMTEPRDTASDVLPDETEHAAVELPIVEKIKTGKGRSKKADHPEDPNELKEFTTAPHDTIGRTVETNPVGVVLNAQNLQPWQLAQLALSGNTISDEDIQFVRSQVQQGNVEIWPDGSETPLRPKTRDRIKRQLVKWGFVFDAPPGEIGESISPDDASRLDQAAGNVSVTQGKGLIEASVPTGKKSPGHPNYSLELPSGTTKPLTEAQVIQQARQIIEEIDTGSRTGRNQGRLTRTEKQILEFYDEITRSEAEDRFRALEKQRTGKKLNPHDKEILARYPAKPTEIPIVIESTQGESRDKPQTVVIDGQELPSSWTKEQITSYLEGVRDEKDKADAAASKYHGIGTMTALTFENINPEQAISEIRARITDPAEQSVAISAILGQEDQPIRLKFYTRESIKRGEPGRPTVEVSVGRAGSGFADRSSQSAEPRVGVEYTDFASKKMARKRLEELKEQFKISDDEFDKALQVINGSDLVPGKLELYYDGRGNPRVKITSPQSERKPQELSQTELRDATKSQVAEMISRMFPDAVDSKGNTVENPKKAELLEQLANIGDGLVTFQIGKSEKGPSYRFSIRKDLPIADRLKKGVIRGMVKGIHREVDSALDNIVEADFAWNEWQKQFDTILSMIPDDKRRGVYEKAFKVIKGHAYYEGALGESLDWLIRSVGFEFLEDSKLFWIGFIPGHFNRIANAMEARLIGAGIRAVVKKQYPESQAPYVRLINTSSLRQPGRDQGYRGGRDRQPYQKDRNQYRNDRSTPVRGVNWSDNNRWKLDAENREKKDGVRYGSYDARSK